MGKATRNPDDALVEYLRGLEERVAALERRTPISLKFAAADGASAELRVFADDSVGLKVFDRNGVLQHNLTAT